MNKRALLILAALVVSNCRDGMPNGILHGFIVDGLTGLRIDFFEPDGEIKNSDANDESKNQIYAVVKGVYIRGEPCDLGDADEVNLINTSGCFRFPELPTTETILIFAQHEGYQPFEGAVAFVLFDPNAQYYDTGPDDLTLVGNIRMFPVGFAYSTQILASFAGAPVGGASVNCQILTGANAFQIVGAFIAPGNTTTGGSFAGPTDADGTATIPSSALVMGAPYHCEIFRADRLNGRVLSGELNFTAGVTASPMNVNLTAGGPDSLGLYAVRSNADDANDLLGAAASLVVTFNRSVEIVPGSLDCMTATLSEPDADGDGTVGALPLSGFNAGESEQVTATVSGDGLTLTLVIKTPTTPIDAGDRGTTISFSGVYVRPTGGADDVNTARVIGFPTGCNADNFAPLSAATDLQNLRTGGDQTNVIRLF